MWVWPQLPYGGSPPPPHCAGGPFPQALALRHSLPVQRQILRTGHVLEKIVQNLCAAHSRQVPGNSCERCAGASENVLRLCEICAGVHLHNLRRVLGWGFRECACTNFAQFFATTLFFLRDQAVRAKNVSTLALPSPPSSPNPPGSFGDSPRQGEPALAWGRGPRAGGVELRFRGPGRRSLGARSQKVSKKSRKSLEKVSRARGPESLKKVSKKVRKVKKKSENGLFF